MIYIYIYRCTFEAGHKRYLKAVSYSEIQICSKTVIFEGSYSEIQICSKSVTKFGNDDKFNSVVSFEIYSSSSTCKRYTAQTNEPNFERREVGNSFKLLTSVIRPK